MLAYLKWLFTPKSDRPAYVLDWFNKNIAVNPKLAPFMGRLNVETAQDELRFIVSSGSYSDEQLWKVHCTNLCHGYYSFDVKAQRIENIPADELRKLIEKA